MTRPARRARSRPALPGRVLRLFVLACGLLPAGVAAQANPFARLPPRGKVPEIPGDPLVPGFSATPSLLSQAYFQAFLRAEADNPSADRMLHAFKHPDMAPVVITFLPRYLSPRLTEPTRQLLHHPDAAVQAGAISGLIGMLDHEPRTRTAVRGLLRSGNAAVRGRAAEYLCWLGTPDDYGHLAAAATTERDVHAKAAMAEAAAAIKRRHAGFGDGPAATLRHGESATATYQQLADALEATPNRLTREAVLAAMVTAEVCEPVTRYADRLDHEERGTALLRLHRLVSGYPASATAPEADADADADQPAAALPVARNLIGPVRDYFDPKRKSYGLYIKPEAGPPFGGNHHVGDDVAWQKDGETVVAIGPGIVRQVGLGRRSWGGLVIIEHTDAADRRFCSLYGHLGPLICVHPGQVVRQGQKLGVVGTSYTHANGGYLSHLHFGIHRSAFLQPDRVGEVVELPGIPGETITATVTAVHEDFADIRYANGTTARTGRRPRWIDGYLTPAEFTSPNHGWTDPQGFIRNFKS